MYDLHDLPRANLGTRTTNHATKTPGARIGVRLLRLREVLEIVPISKSTWFAGIQSGRFPEGHRLGKRVTVWRSDDIDRLVDAVR